METHETHEYEGGIIMEQISLAIVTGDRAYGRALSMALLNTCREFDIRIYENRQFIRESSTMREAGKSLIEKYDLVLWDGPEIRDAYGENIVYLADHTSLIAKDYNRRKFAIYKYSSARTIIAAIFEIYSFLTGRGAEHVEAGDARIFGFASWGGGKGCTTVAMAVAQEFARFRGMKVMYVSLEDVESTGCFMTNHEGVKTTAEYLYRLIQGSAVFLESFIICDSFGVEAFAPTAGGNPLRALSSEQLAKVISSLSGSGRYSAIIIDAGTCISEAGLEALKLAERVCLVSEKPGSDCREIQYMKHVDQTCGPAVRHKAIRIWNMAPRGTDEEELWHESGMQESIVRWAYNPADERGASGEVVSGVSPHCEFGMDIHNLSCKLIEPMIK